MATSFDRAALGSQLARALDSVVLAHEVEIDDVDVAVMGKRLRVQVTIDADRSVDLDLVASVSRDIAVALDDETGIGALLADEPYVLEVSSRGVDRPLLRPAHWRRNIGRLVSCERRGEIDVTGRVISVDEQEVSLLVEPPAGADQPPLTVALADITRATVVVEFKRPDSATPPVVDP
ncbi:MAG: ribosome maturation factor RimP [Candidatus Nanopelagicales bacterium]